jgi:FAD-linked sulfhydryl oxidase
MTREELGRHGWTLLHMISATLPVEFDADFVTKINVFLNLLFLPVQKFLLF